jgi:hypothetical protein
VACVGVEEVHMVLFEKERSHLAHLPRFIPPQLSQRSAAVEQRGFEPPTSSICTIFESSTKRSFIFSFAGVRERVAPARTALRGSDRMPPSILAPSSSVVGSARQSFRRGVPARAQAQRFRVRGKIDRSLIWSSSIGRSWFPIHGPLAQGDHGDGPIGPSLPLSTGQRK